MSFDLEHAREFWKWVVPDRNIHHRDWCQPAFLAAVFTGDFAIRYNHLITHYVLQYGHAQVFVY